MTGVWAFSGCGSWLIFGLIVGGLAVAAVVSHFDGKRHREQQAADAKARAERGDCCPWCERAYETVSEAAA